VHAEKKLAALTPPRGRGKRQITAKATLLEAISRVLKAHRVDGLLSVAWEKQTECKTQDVGRGRGSASRDKRVITNIRYPRTRIVRQGDNIAALTGRFGWQAFVTNAVHKRLSLKDAVVCYRNAYRVERLFNRLQSRVHIAPMFVTRDDHIEGLTHLLTLGVRVLTVMEFVLRRSLQTDRAKLPGLPPDNKQKMTDKPTAERLLKAFSDVSLTIIKHTAGEEILRQLTPLSGVQEEILQRLGVSTSLYRQLEIQEMRN
jgi:transposase